MKTTKQERIVLAAVFAGTNLGMPRPEAEEVQQLLKGGHSLDQAVFILWSGYMDSDEMEKAFITEAKSWLKESHFETREKVQGIWPYNAELFWEKRDDSDSIRT